MATVDYKDALEKAVALSPEEQSRLIRELEMRIAAKTAPASQRSILDLCGLGKEIWGGVDAQEYVTRERSSWN
ncbi:MAG: hypothetical protein WCF17_15640 [Terracidiphilus sp.]